MISAALLLAEISKTPFYIAAGILVAWAVVLAAVGLARGSFGATRPASSLVMGVSVLLVVAVMLTAAMTASKPNNAGAKELKPPAAEQTTGSAPQPSQSGGSASGGGASGGGSASAKPTRTVKLAADASRLAYDTKSLTAKAGTVTIDFDNPAPIRHDVHIESSSGKQLGGTKRIANGKASARLKLPPGTYTFYCSVPGHRQAGMQGTLTVK